MATSERRLLLSRAQPPRRGRRGKALASERRLGVVLILPSAILLAVLVGYPLIYSLYLSLLHDNLLHPETIGFVGLGNFSVLFQMEQFWQSVKNSVIITVATIAIQLVIAFVLALLLRGTFPGRAIVRSIIILPWPIPTFVVASAFIWLLNYNYGLVNHILVAVHLPAHAFLGDPATALPTVVVANIWKEIPWTFVVITAAMALIPADLLEAVRVDGGGLWAEIRHVMLPAMRRVLILVLILRIIWTFNFFDLVYLLTGGGPLNTTMVLPVMIYDMMFQSFQVGLAAAIGTLMVIVLGAFTVALVWAQARTDR